MTSFAQLIHLFLFLGFISWNCFANLPILSNTDSSQAKITNIYVPNPSMMGLNQPATPIRQTGPLQGGIYGHSGVSSPPAYNHYRYLYSTYNYQRMSYPYMAYYGRGARNPGYFNFNRQRSKENEQLSNSENPELRFDGARIINTKSSLQDKLEGRFAAKQFLKLWIKAAGPLKAPPSIKDGETAVYLNTPSDQDVRIITKVQTETAGDAIERFLVNYELKKAPEQSSSFYSLDGQAPKGFMSVAIFAAQDRPIKLVLAGSEDTETQEDQKNVEILDQNSDSWALGSMKNYKEHEGTNITRNYTLRKSGDLGLLRKYMRIHYEDVLQIQSTDWERELVYLTCRMYQSSEEAKDKFDRKITDIYEWRQKTKSTQIKHYVEITEPLSSRDTFDLESVDESKNRDLHFGCHWVRVAKPRNFAGLRTFSIKTPKN